MASLRAFSMLSALIVAGSVTSTMTGCVIEDEDPGPSGPVYKYPAQADFCAALAQAECQDAVVNACYGSDASTLSADRAACVAARTDASTCNPLGLSYNPAAAEVCIAQRKAVYTDAALTKAEIEADYEACLAVFSRGQAAGSTCVADADCDTAKQLRCVVKLGAANGKCGVPEIVSGGLKCDADNQVCADGFYCNETSICQVRPEVNDSCSATVPCSEELLCADICIAKSANGSACTAAETCTGGFCITDGADGVCSAKYTLAITSDTCDEFR